jgi:hypothetical protein
MFRKQIAGTAIFAAVMFTATVFSALMVSAQAPTLQEQLAAQYKLVKMGSDSSGYSVVEEGTLLDVQKGGVIGIAYKDTGLSTNRYENGVIHPPSIVAQKGLGMLKKRFGQDEQTTKLFAKGDKVYPTKIDVNLEKDTVTMGIVACDKCNNVDPPTYNKTNVVFVFAKGTLAKGNAAEVEDTIGQLLTVSTDDQQQAGGGQPQQSGDQGGQAAPQDQGQAQPAAQPQAQPESIEMGMTPDQVVAAMGQPDKKVNLGTKQIYVYKDLKVTFMNGKVSDVQ